ncbi:T9SS type A sorting domain-containing protein [Hymenobacter sp. ASUV-10]|uniref:T9SS type A sorting domain-containing protein n=1 Tax=Hymenobacter aranciens TaxID=3063996 RepID=A0ABT9BDA9_9BACT|nr:T9SS type A sorting domain-containing protein [Hymenobacter sp. ASUV-10]MDO7876243.1 T9SS type A sorting domain-containing protein [Hymenobacter sp. ASUV-10]
MKKHLILPLLALAAWANPVQAQYVPTNADIDAHGTTTAMANVTVNTGTDVMRGSKGSFIQTMVWDGGGNVRLSWSVNEVPTGSLLATLPSGTTSLSDPDVAMSYMGNNLYADVVYIATNSNASPATSQTYLDIYLWNGTAFVQQGSPRPLGLAGIAAYTGPGAPLPKGNRIHSNPNIDANISGKVGIVWQETSTETATVTVYSPTYGPNGIPPYPNGYSFNMTTTFADSYVLDCNIDGTGFYCSYPYRGSHVVRGIGPNTTASNPNILFNQSLTPDVAVSPLGVVSFCYISASADPTALPVTAGKSLVVKQYGRDCTVFNSNVGGTYSWAIPNTLGVPRMAATASLASSDDLDVELVMAWSDSPCTNSGPRNYYEIRNWGKSAGSWRPNYTTVSIPTVSTQNGYDAVAPAVAFLSDQTNPYQYVVAWSGLNYPSTGNGYDVWSRTLKAGSVIPGVDYSRVNFTDTNTQGIVSVAARHAASPTASAFLWRDASVPRLAYRYSTVLPGSNQHNRPAANPTQPTGSNILQAYPNPFSTDVQIRLSLHAGETVRSLQVTDLSGRVLDTLPVDSQAKASTEASAPATYTWHARRGLLSGSYLVRVVTSERTETLSLSKP